MLNKKECAKLFGSHKYIKYASVGKYTQSYIADDRWSIAQYEVEEKRNIHILRDFIKRAG